MSSTANEYTIRIHFPLAKHGKVDGLKVYSGCFLLAKLLYRMSKNSKRFP